MVVERKHKSKKINKVKRKEWEEANTISLQLYHMHKAVAWISSSVKSTTSIRSGKLRSNMQALEKEARTQTDIINNQGRWITVVMTQSSGKTGWISLRQTVDSDDKGLEIIPIRIVQIRRRRFVKRNLFRAHAWKEGKIFEPKWEKLQEMIYCWEKKEKELMHRMEYNSCFVLEGCISIQLDLYGGFEN